MGTFGTGEHGRHFGVSYSPELILSTGYVKSKQTENEIGERRPYSVERDGESCECGRGRC